MTCQADEQTVDKTEICFLYAELAKAIMTARQNGMPMTQVYKLQPKNLMPITSLMITTAYDIRLYHSPELKAEIITDFENTVFSTCLQATEQLK